jgi:hypothetical protein
MREGEVMMLNLETSEQRSMNVPPPQTASEAEEAAFVKWRKGGQADKTNILILVLVLGILLMLAFVGLSFLKAS